MEYYSLINCILNATDSKFDFEGMCKTMLNEVSILQVYRMLEEAACDDLESVLQSENEGSDHF